MNSRFCTTGIIAKFDSFSNIFLTMIIKTIEFMFTGINMFWADSDSFYPKLSGEGENEL